MKISFSTSRLYELLPFYLHWRCRCRRCSWKFSWIFFFRYLRFQSIYFFYDTKSWKESEFKDICKEWKFFSGWVCLKHTAIEFTTVCEMEKERGEIFDMPRDDDDDDEKFPSISPLFVLSDYEMNEWGKYVMLVILVYSVWNISE